MKVLRWLPIGTLQWRRFRRPAEVEQLIAGHGLQVIDRTGVRVNPTTRGFSYTGSLSVNKLAARKADSTAA